MTKDEVLMFLGQKRLRAKKEEDVKRFSEIMRFIVEMRGEELNKVKNKYLISGRYMKDGIEKTFNSVIEMPMIKSEVEIEAIVKVLKEKNGVDEVLIMNIVKLPI